MQKAEVIKVPAPLRRANFLGEPTEREATDAESRGHSSSLTIRPLSDWALPTEKPRNTLIKFVIFHQINH